MTETTIWDIEEHRKEPPGIRNLDFRESFDHLADYLDGYNIREPPASTRTPSTTSPCSPSRRPNTR